MANVLVDFVARDLPHGGWGLVLVEEGPWQEAEVEFHLRRIQGRLYDCIDAALEGKLADQFPESAGKPVLIRLDAYNVLGTQLREFFDRFSTNVMQLPDYAAALSRSTIVPSILFQLNIEHGG